ncbi:MAG: thymidine kinase [Desulfobacteraceae bacterium]|nr:thymidine kinase [Desulfobacteraceae bacterium]
MAKLYYRYGTMNCGKSTALIQVDYNYRERGMNTIIIKPGCDSKGDDKVISRLDVHRRADILASETDDLFTMVEDRIRDKEPVHCVLVDEAQFLTRMQADQLFKVAVILDIPVICYGLRTDFRMDGFPGSERLLLLAHSIEELKTICKCGRKAAANARKMNGRFIFRGKQLAIDGMDNVTYEALCAQCYYRYKRQAEQEME